MGGRKSGYGRFGAIRSRSDYLATAGCRRLRGIIANGGSNHFMPKYPDIAYRPECQLFGMQGLGNIFLI